MLMGTVLSGMVSKITRSPVVALNRALSVGRVSGPEAGLAALDAIEAAADLRDYQPYWAARADVLARAGNRDAAIEAYTRALGLTVDPAVRRYLSMQMATR